MLIHTHLGTSKRSKTTTRKEMCTHRDVKTVKWRRVLYSGAGVRVRRLTACCEHQHTDTHPLFAVCVFGAASPWLASFFLSFPTMAKRSGLPASELKHHRMRPRSMTEPRGDHPFPTSSEDEEVRIDPFAFGSSCGQAGCCHTRGV